MYKEKISPIPARGDYPEGISPDPHSKGASKDETEALKDLYLPNSKADHSPSEENIDRANGLNPSTPHY